MTTDTLSILASTVERAIEFAVFVLTVLAREARVAVACSIKAETMAAAGAGADLQTAVEVSPSSKTVTDPRDTLAISGTITRAFAVFVLDVSCSPHSHEDSKTHNEQR